MTTHGQKKVDVLFLFIILHKAHENHNLKEEKKLLHFSLSSLLTVQSGEGGAFQDAEIVFDFIGIPFEAVEEVLVILRIQFSLFVEGDGSGGARLFRRDVTHRVADHSQQLHLGQQIVEISRLKVLQTREGTHDTFSLYSKFRFTFSATLATPSLSSRTISLISRALLDPRRLKSLF